MKSAQNKDIQYIQVKQNNFFKDALKKLFSTQNLLSGIKTKLHQWSSQGDQGVNRFFTVHRKKNYFVLNFKQYYSRLKLNSRF